MKKKELTKTKKRIRNISILLILIAVVFGITILYKNATKTILNDNPNVNGNTPGNLYNHGLFAESDHTVYFSNPLDKHSLYVMNDDETAATKLSSETVYSLNAVGSYLYYSKNNLNDSNSTSVFRGSLLGAARCNLDGSHVETYYDEYVGTLVLVGNDVYFETFPNDKQKKTTSHKVNTIGIEGGKASEYSKTGFSLACTVGSTVYYAGTENDHNLYSMNFKSKSPVTLVEGNCWMPIVTKNGELYYLDLSNNYALVKTTVNHPTEQTVLVEERISTYNVSDTYIYFQIDDQNNSKLCRIRKDASTNEYEVVAEGNYENINITSRYVYFNVLEHDEETYRTPVNAPVRVVPLSEAVTFEDRTK